MGTAGILAFLILATIGAGLPPESTKDRETGVKAALLLNFIRFVQWPEGEGRDSQRAYRVGVFGRDPFGPVLERTFEEQKVAGRSFELRRCKTVEACRECDLVFIPSSEERSLSELLRALGKSPILTVSDIPSFARRGGMIEFYRKDSRVRFAVNRRTSEEAGLRISSKVLRLAKLVD